MSIKNDLRKYFRKMRYNIIQKNIKDNSICWNVINSELFIRADQILCYYPLENEINTLAIINEALECGKRTALPYCTDSDGSMEFYYINSLEDVKCGMFGIMEPDIKFCDKVTDFGGSLCIVPAFAFDIKGFRLGYGKGYYDKFLKKFTFNSVGLCYNEFLQEILPADFYDVAVKYIATEEKIMLCKEDE